MINQGVQVHVCRNFVNIAICAQCFSKLSKENNYALLLIVHTFNLEWWLIDKPLNTDFKTVICVLFQRFH